MKKQNKYLISFFVKSSKLPFNVNDSKHFELVFEAETWLDALHLCKAQFPKMADWLLMGPGETGKRVFVGPYDTGHGANLVYTGLE